MVKCINKVIVFDLDDTIGHFEELSMFLGGLQFIVDENIKDTFIFKLLDLWPNFIAPGIIEVLKIIKKEKQRNNCIKAIIYTNNMGPRSWTLTIKRYLERKIKSKIFDKIITAYRPNEKYNCRTTYDKLPSDIIKCTGYSKNSKFLFLDDQHHPKMYHRKVKYLFLHPYIFSIPYHTMIDTFLKSQYGKIISKGDRPMFRKYMFDYLNSGQGSNRYIINKTDVSKKDIKQSKMINKEVNAFLKPTTRKNRKNNNKTKKTRRRP